VPISESGRRERKRKDGWESEGTRVHKISNRGEFPLGQDAEGFAGGKRTRVLAQEKFEEGRPKRKGEKEGRKKAAARDFVRCCNKGIFLPDNIWANEEILLRAEGDIADDTKGRKGGR